MIAFQFYRKESPALLCPIDRNRIVMNLSKRIRTYLHRRNKSGTRVRCSDQIEIQLGILFRNSYQNIIKLSNLIKPLNDTFTDPATLPYQSSYHFAFKRKMIKYFHSRLRFVNPRLVTICQSTISYD